MNRPIKFRAWDKERKMMAEEVVPMPPPNSNLFRIARFNDDEVIKKEGYHIGVEHDGFVMQFTGLLDKNGKEIYEGDVVSTGTSKWEIYWGEEKSRGLSLWGWKAKTHRIDDLVDESVYREGEIIGNIYENPELIEK